MNAEINAMDKKKLVEQSMKLEKSHLAKILILNDKEKEQISYAVNSESWKKSAVLVALFITDKRSPVVTLAINIQGNLP